MITDTLIYFVGVPAMLAYLLLLVSFSDKRKGKIKHLTFPIRDAAIATLALDFVVLVPEFLGTNSFQSVSNGFSVFIVIVVFFLFHLMILIFSDRFSFIREQTDAPTHQKRLINLLLATYVGLLCLMTNAVSIQTILSGKGGL